MEARLLRAKMPVLFRLMDGSLHIHYINVPAALTLNKMILGLGCGSGMESLPSPPDLQLSTGTGKGKV